MKIDNNAAIRHPRAVLCCAAAICSTIAAKDAAAQTGTFDGLYAGTQTLAEDSSYHNYSKCLHGPFKRKLEIKDGAVSYTYNPTYQGKVTGTVTADGDVSGSIDTAAGGVALSGRVQGDEFTGEVWSLYCTYTVKLKRVP